MNQLRLFLCVLALGGVACACDKGEPPPSVQRVPLEWTSEVRSAHELADHANSAAQRQAAVAALRKVLQSAPPVDNLRVQGVLQDLHFRLAQALVDNAELANAEAVVAAGLSLGSEPTLTRANLLALQGKIYETQGRVQQAAEALHNALLINEILMNRALAGEVEPERQ